MNRFTRIGIAVAVLAGIWFVAVPQLLSSASVKERIAAQLTHMTGRAVALDGPSSVEWTPYPGVAYFNVTLGNKDAEPLARIEKLEARLSLLSALWGQANVSEVTLTRPKFNLRVDRNGVANWAVSTGPLADIVSASAGTAAPGYKLGSAKIIEGQLFLKNERTDTTFEATSLNGVVEWQNLNASAHIDVSGIWSGEVVQLTAAASSPYDLIRGGSSEASISINGQSLEASFSGTIDSSQSTALGTFSAQSPSIARLIDWMGLGAQASALSMNFAVSGELNASDSRLELTSAAAVLGDQKGAGQLEVAFLEDMPPRLSGTLDFGPMELPDVVGAVLASATGETDAPSDISLLDIIGLDLRVSSPSVQSGAFQFDNVAATILARQKRVSIDIGQAGFEGGTLSGAMTAARDGDALNISTNAVFDAVNLERLTGMVLGADNGIAGTGTSNIMLKTKIGPASSWLDTLDGKASITSTDGAVRGIDIGGIYGSVSEEEDIAIGDFVAGETRFDQLNLGFFIADGRIYLRNSEMTAPNFKVNLSGRGDLRGGALALRGDIMPVADNSTGGLVSLPFFVGGTTRSPLFVPLPTPKPAQSDGSQTGDKEQSALPSQ